MVEDKPKCTINSKEYLDNDQIKVVKDALLFESIRFQTAVTIIIDSGRRREEVLALRYCDINILSGLVTVENAFVKSKLTYNHIIKKVKTKASERRFYITNHALELVKNLRTFKESCGIVVHDDDYIFTAWDSNDLIAPEITSKEW
ncbi:MAG: hypothetical protein ACK5HP_03780 [Bacilli bacterium]